MNTLAHAIALSAAATLAASAGADIQYGDLLQTMKAAAATDLSNYWDRYGRDESSSLTLLTHVDTQTNSFSYTTVAGSTWNGRAASLTTFGSWDQASGTYLYTCLHSFGGQEAHNEGVIDFPIGGRGDLPDTRRASLTGYYKEGGIWISYISDRCTILFRRGPGNTILSDGQWTHYRPDGSYTQDFDQDTYDAGTSVISWTRWYQSGGTASYSGSSNSTTGNGSITATSNPTPGTLALCGLGALFSSRRRR